MLLCEEDIKKIENLGYSRDEFTYIDDDGFVRLKNINGHCIFLDPHSNLCLIYPNRPIGCRLYPVVYNLDKNKCIVDKLCPMWHTVSKREKLQSCRALKKLIEIIFREQKMRKRKEKEI